jgi:hypothetical protein
MNIDLCEPDILIGNDDGLLSYVAIEPWGEEIALRQGDQLHIVGRAPNGGSAMTLRYEGTALVVEGQPGSTLSFTLNGDVLVTASNVIPSL